MSLSFNDELRMERENRRGVFLEDKLRERIPRPPSLFFLIIHSAPQTREGDPTHRERTVS